MFHSQDNFYEIVACRDDGQILNDHLIDKGFARPLCENLRYSVLYPSFVLVEKEPFYESYNHRCLYRKWGVDFNAFEDEFIDPERPYEEQLRTLLKSDKFTYIREVFEHLHSIKL